MTHIQILPLGSVAPELLSGLATGITSELQQPCEFLPEAPEPAYAFNITRQQYSSTEILANLVTRVTPGTRRLLAVTGVDLYIPILTFVFGEAQMSGSCAIVSYHRLRQEFYGLPPDKTLLQARVLKEAVHELGHTHAIHHCEDYQCVMAASHAVEWIDLKTHSFCQACRPYLSNQALSIHG